MKFTKQDLLTLLIGLFLFASCKSTNTIGFQPDPDEKIDGTLENGLTITTSTEKDEAVTTIGSARQPLGFINGDPIFGNTEASIVLSVTLPSNGYSFGTNALIDSAILVLPYSSQFYGDTTTSTYAFHVKQLTTDLSLQKSFLSNKEWPVESAIQGSFLGKIQPKTPVKITEIVSGAADTIKAVVPQLRIKLENTFIQNNIVNLDSAKRSANGKFRAAFKGLQISVDKSKVSGTGGIAFFGFSGTDANIEIYYKKQNATTASLRDTVAVKFPISSTSSPVAATIKHDYAGTKVEEQLAPQSPPAQVSYLQALAGLRSKVSFPDLQAFVTRVKAGNPKTKIVINRAELVVNLNTGTDVAPFTAAQRLALYRLDIAGQRKNVPDNDPPTQGGTGEPHRYAGSEAAFGGFYDANNKRYIFTVTAYIQDLIDGKTEDYGTYLAPSSLTEYNLTPSVSSAARAVINSGSVGTSGQKPIKLNIYYSKIAE